MSKNPKSQPEATGPNDRVYVVKYRMPGEEGRNPRRMTVNAINQTDAIKAAKMTVPGAKVVGGPQELNEGLRDFASAVGRFLARCVGRGCLGYARSAMNADPKSAEYIRKMTTRELAKRAGEKLMDIGGSDHDYPRVVIRNKAPKKRKGVLKPRKPRKKR